MSKPKGTPKGVAESLCRCLERVLDDPESFNREAVRSALELLEASKHDFGETTGKRKALPSPTKSTPYPITSGVTV